MSKRLSKSVFRSVMLVRDSWGNPRKKKPFWIYLKSCKNGKTQCRTVHILLQNQRSSGLGNTGRACSVDRNPALRLCTHSWSLLPWAARSPTKSYQPSPSQVLLHLSTNTAAAAKSLQSCPTLCDPIDGTPPGSPVPGILQARTLEWVAISFSSAWKRKVKVKSLSRVRLLATPWTAAHQAPLSMGFSRQEYWSGVPLPSPDEPVEKKGF